MKWIIVAGVIVATITVGMSWFLKQQHDAEQRGVQKQININIAETNQRIAERRVQDASFDRDDVKRLCNDAGLNWVWNETTKRSICE